MKNITKRLRHVYENGAMYRLGFGHSPQHIAREASILLQLIDRHHKSGLIDSVSVLELGSGPQSLYRDLFSLFRQRICRFPISKYTGTDFRVENQLSGPMLQWDFSKPVKTDRQFDVLMMPYFLVHSLLNPRTWQPFDAKLRAQFERSVLQLLRPGGLLLVHSPYWKHSEKWADGPAWTDEGFIEYTELPGLEELFGLEPGRLHFRGPLFYSTLRETSRTDVHNVDTVRSIEINVPEADDEPALRLRTEFSKSRLFYERERVSMFSNPALKLEGRYMEDDFTQSEDLIEPVSLSHHRNTHYWNVYRHVA